MADTYCWRIVLILFASSDSFLHAVGVAAGRLWKIAFPPWVDARELLGDWPTEFAYAGPRRAAARSFAERRLQRDPHQIAAGLGLRLAA